MNAGTPLLLAAAVTVSGCIMLPIPHDRAISPRFHGYVKDETTGSPIRGATVKVLPHGLLGELEERQRSASTANTNDDGSFDVGAVESRTWFVVLFLPAEGICGGTLFVSHPDYEEAFFEASQFRGAAINGSCTRFKVEREVRLKKRPQPS